MFELVLLFRDQLPLSLDRPDLVWIDEEAAKRYVRWAAAALQANPVALAEGFAMDHGDLCGVGLWMVGCEDDGLVFSVEVHTAFSYAAH